VNERRRLVAMGSSPVRGVSDLEKGELLNEMQDGNYFGQHTG
jgi:hypothetical protein